MENMEYIMEHSLNIIYSGMINAVYRKNLIYALNKEAKYLFVFDGYTTEMIKNDSFLKCSEYDTLKSILKYVDISEDSIKIIALNKVEKSAENLTSEIKDNFYKIFLYQIIETKPEYIVFIGIDVIRNVFMHYLKENNIKEDEYYLNIKKYNFYENMDKIYNLDGIKCVCIYDMNIMKSITNKEKAKMVEILKKIKE